MKTLGILDLARAHALRTKVPVVLIRARSDGGDSRLGRAFPSLDRETLDLLLEEDAVVLAPDGFEEARSAFERLVRDARDESTLVSGTIAMISVDGETASTYDIDEGTVVNA